MMEKVSLTSPGKRGSRVIYRSSMKSVKEENARFLETGVTKREGL